MSTRRRRELHRQGGACTTIPAGAHGVSSCLLGLICSGGKCKRAPSSGACAKDDLWGDLYSCLAGAAYCDPQSNTCMPLLADGTACTTNESCQSGACNNGKCRTRCSEM